MFDESFWPNGALYLLLAAGPACVGQRGLATGPGTPGALGQRCQWQRLHELPCAAVASYEMMSILVLIQSCFLEHHVAVLLILLIMLAASRCTGRHSVPAQLT
jgi:hypothetical protein